jgi:hypothetical protein
VSVADRSATPAARAASWLMVAFGGLAALHAITGGGEPVTGSDLSFAVVVLVAASLCGYELRRGTQWAWWISLILAGVGLFFVLPIAGAVLLGGTAEPVGTGWDVVFFPLTTIVLVALVAVLVMGRR